MAAETPDPLTETRIAQIEAEFWDVATSVTTTKAAHDLAVALNRAEREIDELRTALGERQETAEPPRFHYWECAGCRHIIDVNEGAEFPDCPRCGSGNFTRLAAHREGPATADDAVCGRCSHPRLWHANFGQGECQVSTGCACYEFVASALREGRPPAAENAIIEQLRSALVRIHDGDDTCLCDHNTQDCCAVVGEHCPSCISAKALEKLAVWALSASSGHAPASETPRDKNVMQHIADFCDQVASDGIMPSVAWFSETATLLRELDNFRLSVPPPASETGQASAWQPIATCPPDGLFHVHSDGAIRTMYRSGGVWEATAVARDEYGLSRPDIRVEETGIYGDPTEWMEVSLPLAPSEDETTTKR